MRNTTQKSEPSAQNPQPANKGSSPQQHFVTIIRRDGAMDKFGSLFLVNLYVMVAQVRQILKRSTTAFESAVSPSRRTMLRPQPTTPVCNGVKNVELQHLYRLSCRRYDTLEFIPTLHLFGWLAKSGGLARIPRVYLRRVPIIPVRPHSTH